MSTLTWLVHCQTSSASNDYIQRPSDFNELPEEGYKGLLKILSKTGI